ncbi:hypothetical protein M6B38_197675 [Iris pallida]|uniref:Uncharacterized protein n=1 Tax=Iris pallida TaxID=29817 RepID=A0AAX6EBS4_IRIPA|nr:hypothetical protein M6B38_197675 [Iris pallida]
MNHRNLVPERLPCAPSSALPSSPDQVETPMASLLSKPHTSCGCCRACTGNRQRDPSAPPSSFRLGPPQTQCRPLVPASATATTAENPRVSSCPIPNFFLEPYFPLFIWWYRVYDSYYFYL